MVPRPLLESLARCEAPNLVECRVDKPEGTVWSSRDPVWAAVGRGRKLGDRAAGADAPNIVATILGKPEIAVGSGCGLGWDAADCWDRKFGDGAPGADAPDLVARQLGKPEIAI